MIEAITKRGYSLEINPDGFTVCHKVIGDMATFSVLFDAWKYCEGWGANEP